MTDVVLIDTDFFQNGPLREAVRSALSLRRLQKADGFRREKDRFLSLGAGTALDFSLFSAGLREQDALLSLGEHGKPFLQGRPDLFFNLSHSGHYAVCALSGREVGADIEEIHMVREALLRKVCTERELRLLLMQEEAEKQNQFFRLWAGKESFLKYLGTGLSLSPKKLEIDFGPPVSLRREGNIQPVVLFQRRVANHWLSVCTDPGEQVRWKAPTKEELERFYGLSPA